MWNNSYRTPTECWQKTSDFSKGKKLPMYLGKAKEKRKNRDKRIGIGPAPRRELWRRKSFHTLGSPSLAGIVGSFRASEKRAATGVRRESGEVPTQRMGAKQHSPAWDASLLTHWGRQVWELKFRLWRSDARDRTAVGCVKTAWGG